MSNFGKQPKAIAKLKGTHQPCRYPETILDGGLVFLTQIPTPPKRLGAIGTEFWNNILGGAIGINGYIAIHDIYMFEELCYVYQTMTKAKDDIEIFGNTTVTESGQRVRSIGYQIYKESLKDFQSLCREFGLSPSSRNSLKFQEYGEKKTDPLAAFSL